MELLRAIWRWLIWQDEPLPRTIDIVSRPPDTPPTDIPETISPPIPELSLLESLQRLSFATESLEDRDNKQQAPGGESFVRQMYPPSLLFELPGTQVHK